VMVGGKQQILLEQDLRAIQEKLIRH
jgi:ATP-dependent Lhr-like helicase